jgi:XTP/dITP diphosphohydrolase
MNPSTSATRHDPLLRLVVASANPHKVAEMNELLGRELPGIELVPRPDDIADVAEDADTLLGNARLKAAAISTATGEPAVADDTGLDVDALEGRPGVRTARYAGENATAAQNRSLLLAELAMVGAASRTQRSARFRTVAIVVWPDGSEVYAEGVAAGHIAWNEQGSGGFGYDSLFAPDGFDGQTFAELGSAVKQQISHRAKAFTALAIALQDPSPALPTA